MTARQAAEKWTEVKKHGRSWMIPSDTKKPNDPQKSRMPANSASLSCLLSAGDRFLPGQELGDVLQTLETDAFRSQWLGEIAYLRGDFYQGKRMLEAALQDKSTCICACTLSLVLAICTNDFPLYSRIGALLKRRIEADEEPQIVALAEAALATATVSMFAPEMAPGWLKEGDFSLLPTEALPFALYLRIKYLHNLADYSQMFAVAQTALTLLKGKGVVMYIQLLLLCATASIGLGEKERARAYLKEALALGMPHGFITPFAENIPNLHGLVEECVKEQYPDAYDAVLAQWHETWKNWAMFHNRFARDNVPLILTLRELRIATLAATRVPYAAIAEQECLSVGRVRNIIQEIYDKLSVRSRDKLADLVLWHPKKT